MSTTTKERSTKRVKQQPNTSQDEEEVPSTSNSGRGNTRGGRGGRGGGKGRQASAAMKSKKYVSDILLMSLD